MRFFSEKMNLAACAACAGTLFAAGTAFAETADARQSFSALFALQTAALQSDTRSIFANLDARRYENFDAEKSTEIFAEYQFSDFDSAGVHDAAIYDFDFAGALAGANHRFGRTGLAGIAISAGTGDADIHGNGGKIETAAYRANVYISRIIAEKTAFDFGAQFAYGDHDIKCKTEHGNVSADTDGWSLGVFGNFGTQLTISKEFGIFVEPYIRAEFQYSTISGFDEGGNGAQFAVEDIDGTSFSASVGCNFAWEFELAGARSRIALGIAYTRDFTGDEVDVDATLLADEKERKTVYSLSAGAFAEEFFTLGATAEIGVTETFGVFAAYACMLGTDSSSAHGVSAGVRARF